MKRNYKLIFAVAGVLTLTTIGTLFLQNKNSNISQNGSVLDVRKVYTVSDRGDGWKTLNVPYYGYQIDFPTDMQVENTSGYLNNLQSDGEPITVYQVSRAGAGSFNLAFGINIDISPRKNDPLIDELDSAQKSSLRDLEEAMVNGLVGHSYKYTTVHAPYPKGINKAYLLSFSDEKKVILSGLIGNEENPTAFEKEFDQIVSTFRKID